MRPPSENVARLNSNNSSLVTDRLCDQIDAGIMAATWGTINAGCQRIETDPRWSTEGDWEFEGGGWFARSCFLISSGVHQAFVMSTEGISEHICIGWVSCETPVRIFPADRAEVLKHLAIPYWEASHTHEVQKHVFGIANKS